MAVTLSYGLKLIQKKSKEDGQLKKAVFGMYKELEECLEKKIKVVTERNKTLHEQFWDKSAIKDMTISLKVKDMITKEIEKSWLKSLKGFSDAIKSNTL
jgi:hypothetical protein